MKWAGRAMKGTRAHGRVRRVGVEKGFGPRHAANAKEGEVLRSPKGVVGTDTVPAMLTPREAVLNRNAAELAGRGKIKELNAKGNLLAERGIDLASGPEGPTPRRAAKGEADVGPSVDYDLWYEGLLRRMRERLREGGKAGRGEFDPAGLPVFRGPGGKYYDPFFGREDQVLGAQGGRSDIGGDWRFLTVGQGNVPIENWYSARHHGGVELPDWAASMSPGRARREGYVIDPHGYDPRSWFQDPLGRWNYAGDVSSGGGSDAIEYRWPGGSKGLEGKRGKITSLAEYRRRHGGGGGRFDVTPGRGRLRWGGKGYRDLSDPRGPLGMGTSFWETPSRDLINAPRADWSGAMPGWYRPFGGDVGGGEVGKGQVIIGGPGKFGRGVYTGEVGGPGDPGPFGGEGGGGGGWYGTIPSGPFEGWTPSQMDAWHSGAGFGQLGLPSYSGSTAGPGGQQLAFPTTSYNVPGYGWVPQAQLANAQASTNLWDYLNPFGGTTSGGSGTGVPTQKAVGTAVGTLSNLFLPGIGFVTGPVARWITSKIQGGAKPADVIKEAVAQGKVPPMPSGSVPIGGGGSGYAPSAASPTGGAPVGREWWSEDFGRGRPDTYDLGARGGGGVGNYNLAGPGGGFGQRGTGFGSGTVGNFATAIGFGGNLGGGGPVNAGRYMGVAGLARPFSQAQYEAMPGSQKYAAPALSGAAGGVTQRPSYEQYLSGWHPAAAWGEDLLQRDPNLSRHMGQRQNQAKGTSDVKEGKEMKKETKKYQSGAGNVRPGRRLDDYSGYPAPARLGGPEAASYGGGRMPGGSVVEPPKVGAMAGGNFGLTQPQMNLQNYLARGGKPGGLAGGRIPGPTGGPLGLGGGGVPPSGIPITPYPDWGAPPPYPVGHGNITGGPMPWKGGRGVPPGWGSITPEPMPLGGGGGYNIGAPGGQGGYGGFGGGGMNWQGLKKLPSASFYGGSQRFQGGSSEVREIGDYAGAQQAYGPPINLSAPDILRNLQKAAKDQGLSKEQTAGLMQAFSSIGGGGMTTYGEGSATSQALGPALEGAFAGGYQGGISDIGYPPMVAPGAEYHADKGSTWIGPYDRNYMIPQYWRGTASVW